MTPIQKVLLQMVKEIDEICRRNKIDYYLSGGSVIGAIRHQGFIPWDDDIDILMDRKNWNRFWKIAQEELPSDRKLECFELNENFNNTINRYINTKTLNIHKNELLGDSNAGIVIDIILLDEIQDGPDYYWKYVKNLEIYSDLINDAYMYLLRWNFRVPYRYYLLQMKIFGRKYVLNKQREKMLKCTTENGDKYVVAWGGGPTQFSKEILGKPCYVKFEDTFLPIPERAYEFASTIYGYDWINIPKQTEQNTHDTILSFTYSYNEWLKRLEKVGWGCGIRQLYRKHKTLAIQWAPRQNKDSRFSVLIEACKIKTILERRIYEQKIQVELLWKNGEYETLRELFHEFIEKQCSKAYTGSEMWDGLIRKNDPVFIDIPDQLLYYVLSLLLYDGDLTKISRVLYARETCKTEKLTDNLLNVKIFINEICNIIELYRKKLYLQAYERIEKLNADFQDLGIVSKLKIRIWKKGLLGYEEESKRLVLKENQRFPEDGEFIKYYADLLRAEGGIEKACYLYKEAFDHTRNGIIWNEIFEILLSEVKWLYEKEEELITMGSYCKASSLLQIWGIIPDILTQSMEYQYCYFKYRIASFESQEELKEISNKILQLWNQTVDHAVLLKAYVAVMEKAGNSIAYPEREIILRKRSSYEELKAMYLELNTALCISPELRFIKAAAAHRMGKIGEAFQIYRSLWREKVCEDNIRAILANDLLKQIQRMNILRNDAAKHYFIREWEIKYPDAQETAEIMVDTGMCSKENLTSLKIAIGAMLNDQDYLKSIRRIANMLFVNQTIVEMGLIQ